MPRHPLAARDVPPGEPWTFDHPSLQEVIAAEAAGGGGRPGVPPRPAYVGRPGDVDAAFLALRELCFAAAQVAEALGYARLGEADPRRRLRQARGHVETALANLQLALR